MAPYEGAALRNSVLTTPLHLKGQELLSFSNLAFENAHVRPYRCSKRENNNKLCFLLKTVKFKFKMCYFFLQVPMPER